MFEQRAGVSDEKQCRSADYYDVKPNKFGNGKGWMRPVQVARDRVDRQQNCAVNREAVHARLMPLWPVDTPPEQKPERGPVSEERHVRERVCNKTDKPGHAGSSECSNDRWGMAVVLADADVVQATEHADKDGGLQQIPRPLVGLSHRPEYHGVRQ